MKNGQTTVRVWRRDIDERSKRETVKVVHEGIVVAIGSAFARVFNPHPKDGDRSPEFAERFPIAGKNLWLEVTGEKKEAIRLPVSFAW